MRLDSRLALAAALALVQVQASPDQRTAKSQPQLSNDFDVGSRTTFRVWPSHGELAPSLDGRFVYFGENGPEGLVLKRASLSSGAVASLAKTPHEIDRVAPIPGDSRHVVAAWQAGLGGALPHGVSLVSLESGEELEFDTGEPGGDGSLQVSPSGRFLATGRAVVQPVRGPWYPSEIAIYALPAGRREFTFKIPPSKDQVGNPESAHAQVPANVSVAWTKEDILVIRNGVQNAFRRGPEGAWLRLEVSGRLAAHPVAVQRILYSGERFKFRSSGDEGKVEVAPEALFTRGGTLIGYHLTEGAVVLRETRGSDGWNEVEAVVLKWKKGR